MSLQLALLKYGAYGVRDRVASARIGGARVVAGSRLMPDVTDVGVGIYFEALVTVRVHCDPLHNCCFQVIHKVDSGISVGRSRVLGDTGALMRRVSNIRPGAPLQEFDLLKDSLIIETCVKWRCGGILLENLGRKGFRLLRRRVLGEVDIADDPVNDMCLCQKNISLSYSSMLTSR